MFLKSFLFFVLLGGINGFSLNGRIINGEDASIEEFPHQALIYSRNHKLCSGTIISKKYILTTGRCLYGFAPHDLRVRVGSAQDGKGKIYKVNKYRRHDNQEHNVPNFYDYDIGLITLETTLGFSKTVNRILLPNPEEDLTPDTSAIVAGWGESNASSIYDSKILQKARVSILPNEICTEALPDKFVSSRMICAGFPGIQMARRDVGGCLIANNKLHGLMSLSHGYSNSQNFGVFVKITALRDWIKNYTGI